MRALWMSLLLCLLPAAACTTRSGEQQADDAGATPPPIEVEWAKAATRLVDKTVSVTGSLHPDETATISTEVSGRVLKVSADFGQKVRRGQVIAELDKQENSLHLERSRASLAQALARIGLNPDEVDVTPESTPAIRQASAQLDDARYKYENAARLVETGDISQERYHELQKEFLAREAALEATKNDLRTQLANIRALRAEVRLVQKHIRDATVRAPFTGSVSERFVSPGQYLRENTPIISLVKTAPLRLRLEVPETVAALVRVGTALTFTTDAAPGSRFQAVVQELNPNLDARSRSLTAEARITQPDPRLRPGMFVQVRVVVSPDATVVVVPQRALHKIAGLTKLFVVREGRVIEHRLTTGQEWDGWVEVPSDVISPDEKVALSNLGLLVDGMLVRELPPEGAGS